MCFNRKIIQVLLCVLGFYFVNARPQEQYYVGENNDQQYYYNYQPKSVVYYSDELNKPVFHHQLGMSPQYHNLVYNYVKDFAGTEPPAHVNTFQPNVLFNPQQQFNAPETFGNEGNVPLDNKDLTTNGIYNAEATDKPGLNDYFLPSDLLSPKTQFYGHLDAIKMKRMNPKSRPSSYPPLGGVVSNYVLLRGHSNPQNLLQVPGAVKESEANLQHIKRETEDNSDGVVILAEPIQNAKMTEENEQPKEAPEGNNKEEEQMETNPGIAQSKPSAIALAGPGGVAQASPVGTALVGQGGLAVAAPSGTAVAGPAGQGAVPVQIGGEKQKTTEKSEESDSY